MLKKPASIFYAVTILATVFSFVVECVEYAHGRGSFHEAFTQFFILIALIHIWGLKSQNEKLARLLGRRAGDRA